MADPLLLEDVYIEMDEFQRTKYTKRTMNTRTAGPPTYFSAFWWITSIIFSLFTVVTIYGYLSVIHPVSQFSIFSIMAFLILSLFCTIFFRVGVHKKQNCCQLAGVPSDETDEIQPALLYVLVVGVISYGAALCIFEFIVYPYARALDSQNTGILTSTNLLQFIRLTSIQFYALHRIVRPANRIDPLRTILDLEISEICLDAIDLSVVFSILFVNDLDTNPTYIITLSQIALVFWNISLTLRVSSLYMIHLPHSSWIWKLILRKTPFHKHVSVWHSDRTADTERQNHQIYSSRCLIALRFRFYEHLLDLPPEFLSMIVRICLLSVVGYNFEQIGFLWKNVIGLWRIVNAYRLYKRYFFHKSKTRPLWRRVLCCICSWWSHFPAYNWFIVWSTVLIAWYIVIGIILDSYIASTFDYAWIHVFSLVDIMFCVGYCRILRVFIHNDEDNQNLFLVRMMLFMPFMELNIGAYRFPLLCYHASDLPAEGIWSFAALTNVLTLIVIPYYAFHEAIKYIFLQAHTQWNPELVGLYKIGRSLSSFRDRFDFRVAVEPCDPSNVLTAQSAVSEGVVDILSCVTFFVMATDQSLSVAMQRTCLAFSILELLNGGICFVTSTSLYLKNKYSGSAEYPLKVKAISRFCRWFIDTGSFITRMIAWLQFGIVDSPFMIKNLFHINHAFALMERSVGTMSYDWDVPFGYGYEPDCFDWDEMKIDAHRENSV